MREKIIRMRENKIMTLQWSENRLRWICIIKRRKYEREWKKSRHNFVSSLVLYLLLSLQSIVNLLSWCSLLHIKRTYDIIHWISGLNSSSFPPPHKNGPASHLGKNPFPSWSQVSPKSHFLSLSVPLSLTFIKDTIYWNMLENLWTIWGVLVLTSQSLLQPQHWKCCLKDKGDLMKHLCLFFRSKLLKMYSYESPCIFFMLNSCLHRIQRLEKFMNRVSFNF